MPREQSLSVSSTRARSKKHSPLRPINGGGGGRPGAAKVNATDQAAAAATAAAAAAGEDSCAAERRQQELQQHRCSRQQHLLTAADTGGGELPVVPAAFSRLAACDNSVAAASPAVTCDLSYFRCQSDSLQPAEQWLPAPAEQAAGPPPRSDSCDSRAGEHWRAAKFATSDAATEPYLFSAANGALGLLSAPAADLCAQLPSADSQTEISRGDSSRDQDAVTARHATDGTYRARCSVDSPIDELSSYLHQSTKPTSERLACSILHHNQVCSHEETLEVLLEPWEEERCVGFTLFDCYCTLHSHLDTDRNGAATAQRSNQPAFASVEHGSSAARSGVIFAGDRLLSINGHSTKDKAASDVAGMLSQFRSKGCRLEVAFDVQELVTIEQGVYTVRMLKSRDSDLGLKVASLSDDRDGTGLTVVDIKKGSAAYRQGCIRTGDRLLSTNDGTLACRDSDDCILTLIHDLEGPVSLKFLRVPCQAVTSPHITYTVQLEDSRWSELGVTLDGSQDSNAPIVISHIRPGGVAAHAGLLHVGDRILAVNGVSVVGCRPSQAAQLLQLQSKSIALQVQHTISTAGYDWISSVAVESGADSCSSSSDSSSNGGDSTRRAAAAAGSRAITGCPSRTGRFGGSSAPGGYGSSDRATKHRRALLVGRRGSDVASDCTQLLQLSLRCTDDEHGFGFSLVGCGSDDEDGDFRDYGDCCHSRRGNKDGYESSCCYVIAVQPGGAAERAGLRAYDRLLGVDGTAVAGLTYDDVVRRVQAASAVAGVRSIALEVGRCCTGIRAATLHKDVSAADDRLSREDGSSTAIAATLLCSAADGGGDASRMGSQDARCARQ